MKPVRLLLTPVDVSPAMIDAGLRVLHESGAFEYESSSDGLLVHRILDAALAAHVDEQQSYLKRSTKLRIHK